MPALVVHGKGQLRAHVVMHFHESHVCSTNSIATVLLRFTCVALGILIRLVNDRGLIYFFMSCKGLLVILQLRFASDRACRLAPTNLPVLLIFLKHLPWTVFILVLVKRVYKKRQNLSQLVLVAQIDYRRLSSRR